MQEHAVSHVITLRGPFKSHRMMPLRLKVTCPSYDILIPADANTRSYSRNNSLIIFIINGTLDTFYFA